MLQKFLVYIILWRLFRLLIEINCQTAPFNPSRPRLGHTATLIDNKLYILGGRINYNGNNTTNDFFYLDVSDHFNTQNLSWKELPSPINIPPHEYATSVKGGANNNTLFLYGGYTNTSDVTMEPVYTLNPQSNSWNIPNTGNNISNRRFALTGIVDHNGIMYLWGGSEYNNGSVNSSINNILVLDTINLSWGIRNGAPATARDWYAATLLPDNKIIYIGGYDTKSDFSLNQVLIYDTIADKWNITPTSGTVPSNRSDFSAILGLDGKSVIIFGGNTGSSGNTFDPLESLYELNLTNFNWSIPNTSGQQPEGRAGHKANVIGKYMVISFGYASNTSNYGSDILLFDISNANEYIWTNEFVLSPTSPHAISIGPIIGAIIGGLLFVVILLAFGFFLYKWIEERRIQRKFPPIYSYN